MKDIETMNVYEKLKEIEIALARIEEKLENKTEKIIDLEKQIYGNGRDGLIDRINKLEKFEAKVVALAIVGSMLANFAVSYYIKYAVK